MKFGFLIKDEEINIPGCLIKPLGEYLEIKRSFEESEGKIRGWIYPPLMNAQLSHNENGQPPKIYSSIFSLSPTHEIRTQSENTELNHFIIMLYGFLNGVRLIPEGWVNFYRTAYEVGKLVDFLAVKKEIIHIIELGIKFYHDKTQQINKKLFGAIHWYLFSWSYEHPFERFDAQYKVLDTCANILANLRDVRLPKHSKRIVFLSEELNIPLPSWAELNPNKQSSLSKLRNELTHESLYAGEPIGFAHPDENFDFELAAFNSRVIIALLDVKCEYISTPSTIHQTFGIDIIS